MARRSWVYINGVAYERGVDHIPETTSSSHNIQPDLPDFVSPIDGSIVRGRAGLRDHCRKHNVVPTEELRGLPPKPAVYTAPPTREQREQTRRVIADVINSRGY